jgi:hypothetical protein
MCAVLCYPALGLDAARQLLLVKDPAPAQTHLARCCKVVVLKACVDERAAGWGGGSQPTGTHVLQ